MRSEDDWKLSNLSSPWGEAPSIFRQIDSTSEKPDTSSASFEVPPALEAEARGLWVKHLSCSVHKLTENATEEELGHLAELLRRGPAENAIDEIIEYLSEKELAHPERLYELGCYCITRAQEAGAIRFGIALVGLFPNHDGRVLLQRIGRLGVFAAPVISALLGIEEDADLAIWELAKTSTGRSRKMAIAALGETLREQLRPEIESWVLREGWREKEVDPKLLWLCARSGKLIDALRSPDLRDCDFDGAAALLLQMMEMPVQNQDQHDELQLALEYYLRKMSRRSDLRALSIDHVLTLDRARAFLMLSNESAGQSPDLSHPSLVTCYACMDRPEWKQRIECLLKAEDRKTFERAAAAADVLGMDVWEHHRSRIEKRPSESASWLRLVQTDDDERLSAAINLAEESFTAGALMPGGDLRREEQEVSECFAAHDTLGAMLLRLTGKKGVGCKLLQMALLSPITHVRHSALSVLDSWERLPKNLVKTLERAMASERHSALRKEMRRLLLAKNSSG